MFSFDPLLHLAAFFYLYAFTGWCVEVAYHALTTGHFINRGMLAGPVCPIYGVGMLLLALLMEPFQHSWLLTFIGAFVICSLLELAVGLVLRWLFHAQWWDYSKEPFNIAGLICLRFSLAWGAGGAFLIKIVHPLVQDVTALVPTPLLLVLNLAFTAILIADLIITVSGILHLRHRYELLSDIEAQIRDASNAIGMEVTERTLDVAERVYQEVEENRAEWNDRRDALEARRDAFDDFLQTRADHREERRLERAEDIAAFKARLAALDARYQNLREARTRTESRLAKAFPELKWLEGKNKKH